MASPRHAGVAKRLHGLAQGTQIGFLERLPGLDCVLFRYCGSPYASDNGFSVMTESPVVCIEQPTPKREPADRREADHDDPTAHCGSTVFQRGEQPGI